MSKSQMPQVPFGKHSISRLIVGGNTINAGSHLSRFVNMQMKKYFSPNIILEHLNQCSNLGINTWQSTACNFDSYKKLLERGSTMNFISLGYDSDDNPDELQQQIDAGVIGIAHHGEFTDQYFKAGEFNKVREYCKKVRDAGLMVGISSHMPDALQRVLDEGWDVDYFMCCVYERHRTREELQKLLGAIPMPVSEVYLESDPERMFKVIRQTDKTCLAFKILAAGRLCDKQETVEQAFKTTFEAIKPTDAVIVGMYPEYEDQVTMNVDYVNRFSSLSK